MPAGVGRHAASPTLRVAGVDITSLYADGMSLYESRGGSPTEYLDESGLFLGMLGGLLGATDTLEPYLDYNDEVIDTGSSYTSYLSNVFGAYALNQMADIH